MKVIAYIDFSFVKTKTKTPQQPVFNPIKESSRGLRCKRD